jgi:hypothetical protein
VSALCLIPLGDLVGRLTPPATELGHHLEDDVDDVRISMTGRVTEKDREPFVIRPYTRASFGEAVRISPARHFRLRPILDSVRRSGLGVCHLATSVA